MPGIAALPLTAKASGLITLAGFILFAIGFATHFWSYSAVYGYATEGLWLGCYESDCKAIFEYGPLPAWFIATMVIECIGIAAAVVALGLVVIYLFPAKGNTTVCIVAVIACFAAAGCILLGTIIYGATLEVNLAWSFVLCVIGGVAYGMAGVLLIITLLVTRKTQKGSGQDEPLTDII